MMRRACLTRRICRPCGVRWLQRNAVVCARCSNRLGLSMLTGRPFKRRGRVGR